MDDRRFNQLAASSVFAGFMLLLTALVAIVLTVIVNQRSAALVTHTYRVVAQLTELQLHVERAETGVRGYLLSPDPRRMNTFRSNADALPRTVAELGALMSDNPVQVKNMGRLQPVLAEQMRRQAAIMKIAVQGNMNAARRAFVADIANSRVATIRSITADMRAEEEGLLKERSASEKRLITILFVVLGATGALLLGFGAALFILVRRYTATLQRTRDRLHVLNTDLEGAVAERTADLQRANDEIQRFAYIVSHDLRSPLVNILGFTAELEETNKSLSSLLERAEKEAPQIITPDSQAARQDLPEAIGFIRSSTQKMDRLINAILKLSREGRRNLSAEPLDMVTVFEGIVASLEQRLNAAGATITITRPLPPLVSDRVAIEQIFSNIIENAVKYLQPGRPGEVNVTGEVQGDRVIFSIADNGRGIDPKDHERVFDLFRRAGQQDQPGEGIGLAHVRALAYRLGGYITLTSQLGEGAIFQVNLPATYSDEGSKS